MVEDIFKDMEQLVDTPEEQKIDLGPISRLADQQALLERDATEDLVIQIYDLVSKLKASVEDVEEVLKRRKKDLFDIRQTQIPEIMKEFGLSSLKTSAGNKIEIKTGISITVRNKDGLYSYLRNNGAGDLVKNIITVDVENEEERKEVIAKLDETMCSFDSSESVHSATLKKYVSDALKEGKQMPEDVLNVYQYEFSKLKK